MKERSKESKERKAAAVAEEKTLKEKAAAASCAGVPPRVREKPLSEVTQDDLNHFIDVFNEAMIRMSAAIPTVDILSAQASRQLSYLMQRYPMSKLETMVEKAAISTFLNGGGRRMFRAEIEWLTREQNFIKVLNGKYDDVPPERRWKDPDEERKQQEHEQRLRILEMEEAEREQRRRQREYDAAHAATPEEIQRIMASFELPRLTPEQQEYLRRRK